MSLPFKVIESTYPGSPHGLGVEAALNTRQELRVPNYSMQLSMDGRVFIANVGTATTPIDLAKTAYDADQPQVVVDVPSGKTIVPLYLGVYLEDSAGTDTEIIWGISDCLVGAGTSTAVTPVNMRTDNAYTTSCTVRSLYTANGTDVTGSSYKFAEFYRSGTPFADEADHLALQFEWSAQTHVAPVIVGEGSLVMWADGTTTAPAGYVTVIWWEADTTQVT